jgi:hypothetical protein
MFRSPLFFVAQERNSVKILLTALVTKNSKKNTASKEDEN